MVYNLCLGYVQNTEDAEDLTQEIFIKVHQNFNSFDDAKASLKTWIYKIGINICLDFIKAKKTKKRFGFLSSMFNIESNEPIVEISDFNHPGILLEQKEEYKILFRCINSLPENQKTVILLSKVEGFSQKEIAETMNLSIKAVESLYQRAKQNISKKIK
jgi:RNA polymerase sigma-70 factor (ECF subfamily)